MVRRFILIILTLCTALPNAGLLAMDADDAVPMAPAMQNVLQDEAAPAQQNPAENPECSICLEPMTADNLLAHLHEGQGHQHTFHARCIAQAQERDARCPMCRRVISAEEQETIRDTFMQLDPDAARKLEQDIKIRSRKKVAAALGVLGLFGCWVGGNIGAYYSAATAWTELNNENAVGMFKKAIRLKIFSEISLMLCGRIAAYYVSL